MKNKEQFILNEIKKNPFITQQELAERIGLSRPATANIISGLIKKKYILGKAYIVNEEDSIICIGAANVDRKFYCDTDLQSMTSNPVKSTKSIGGVARNIAENLGRLGENVTFLTAAGNDSEWSLIKNLSEPFMNTNYIQPIENASTGSYTAIIDKKGDMQYGFADMNIYEEITPEFLSKQSSILLKAKCLVIDLNLPKKSIEYLTSFAEKNNIKLVIVPVSSPKMIHMPNSLHSIDWLIINRDETETFLKMKIDSNDDMSIAAEKLINLGVSNVIITNGLKPLIFKDNSSESFHSVISSKNVVDVTGAGDSFTSAVIYSWLKNYTNEDIINLALLNSKKTVETNYTVRQNLDQKQLEIELEEFKNEKIS